MIKAGPAIQFSVLGKRENNEDFGCFENNGHFIVCDGVGGSQKGEVASALVAEHFLKEYLHNPDARPEAVLKGAEDLLSDHIRQFPDTFGMATTLTFSQIRKDGILAAWVGDSRIYQIRNGRILYQTEDHSWVNEALKAGIITKEEAVGHPKSNIITRAIQGSEKPTQIEWSLLSDVCKGDYFLHCSDGVLESWSNEELEVLFAQGFSAAEIMARMEKECEMNSRDNSTAILYEVEFADISTEVQNKKVEAPSGRQPVGKGKQENAGVKSNKWVLAFLAVLVIAGIFFYPKMMTEKKAPARSLKSKNIGSKKPINLDSAAHSRTGVIPNITTQTKPQDTTRTSVSKVNNPNKDTGGKTNPSTTQSAKPNSSKTDSVIKSPE